MLLGSSRVTGHSQGAGMDGNLLSNLKVRTRLHLLAGMLLALSALL